MISTDFSAFSVSDLTFLLSTVVGSDKVIEELSKTLHLHLIYLETQVASYQQGFVVNAESHRLSIKLSIEIVSKAYRILWLFNMHSSDLLSSKVSQPVPDYRLKDFERRYVKCMDVLRKILDEEK